MKKPRLLISQAAAWDILGAGRVVHRPVRTEARQTLGESSHIQHIAYRQASRNRNTMRIPIAAAQGSETRHDRGFPKHLLFYRFDDAELQVLRVVHGARDLERLL